MNEGYIPIPNSIFDKYMKELGHNDFIILLAIIRKTWGWNKTEDRISVSQISSMTNYSKPTIIKSLSSLEKIGIISTKKRHNRTTKIKLMLGKEFLPHGKEILPQVVKKFNTQQYNNNTYKPRHQDNVVLGGLMDLSQFEDS